MALVSFLIQCKERNPLLRAGLVFFPGMCCCFLAPSYLADEKSSCSGNNNPCRYAKGICDSQQESCISGERESKDFLREAGRRLSQGGRGVGASRPFLHCRNTAWSAERR